MGQNQLGSIDLGPLDDGLQDLGLPVPVQTFLWGQIAPFIRPKLGKLHEAACMVCIKIFFLFRNYYSFKNNKKEKRRRNSCYSTL